MSSISSLNAASALLFLQQSNLSSASAQRLAAPAQSLVETANGISGAGGPVQQVSGRVAESMFDSRKIDLTEMKTRLFERLGNELGLSMDDFEKASDFGRAVRTAVAAIRMQEDGDLLLRTIEKKLGLDELGISLDTLVEALTDPDGDANDRLDVALARQVGQDQGGFSGLALDENGIYGF